MSIAHEAKIAALEKRVAELERAVAMFGGKFEMLAQFAQLQVRVERLEQARLNKQGSR